MEHKYIYVDIDCSGTKGVGTYRLLEFHMLYDLDEKKMYTV